MADKSHIFNFLSKKTVEENIKKISIVAGEANISFYEELCNKIVASNNPVQIELLMGPEISTWSCNSSLLNKKLPVDGLSDEQILSLHPLFRLKALFGNRVRLYLKLTNDDRHFAFIGDGLYIEERHKPLKESRAVWIERPNYLLRSKYKNMLKNAIERNSRPIESIDDMRCVPFAYFVDCDTKEAVAA